jgi:hypothetical protein
MVTNLSADYPPPPPPQDSPPKHSVRLLVAGAILVIVSSFLAFIAGVAVIALAYSIGYFINFIISIVSFLGFLALPFGLTAGLFTLRKKYYKIAISGISLAMILESVAFVVLMVLDTGVSEVFAFPFVIASTLRNSLIFVLPSVVLSIIALAFVKVSKSEFR